MARNGSRRRIARFSGACRAEVRGRRFDLDKLLAYSATYKKDKALVERLEAQ
jgi:hypothetical protein